MPDDILPRFRNCCHSHHKKICPSSFLQKTQKGKVRGGGVIILHIVIIKHSHYSTRMHQGTQVRVVTGESSGEIWVLRRSFANCTWSETQEQTPFIWHANEGMHRLFFAHRAFQCGRFDDGVFSLINHARLFKSYHLCTRGYCKGSCVDLILHFGIKLVKE